VELHPARGLSSENGRRALTLATPPVRRHFWQLGESFYWGHNAIIRVAPFMRHCALGRLPGRGPFAGEILSHDFVEAALMRRAGWKVWMAYDLPGSYEEMPPNLLDELKRDRRWCRGNLINSRLFLWGGLHPAHRAVFMTGVMVYVSAPLWLLSLALSSTFVVLHAVIGPQYFVQPRQLFPIWPEWDAHSALMFAIATGGVLFVPKILGGILVLARGADRFGGAVGVTLSVLIELLLASALAPVRMLFHTQFVIAALTNLQLHWKSPPREDAETTWGEAARRHGLHTLLGLGWGVGVYWLAPSYIGWLLPVAGALVLAIPSSPLLACCVRAGAVGKHDAPRRGFLEVNDLFDNEGDTPSGAARSCAPYTESAHSVVPDLDPLRRPA
jgi:membrane glycosyltransferase